MPSTARAGTTAQAKSSRVMLKFLQLMRRLLQTIDLGVNVLERLRVGGSEKFTACFRGDFLQRVFVDIDLRHRKPFVAECVGHRNRSFAAHPGGDCVNLDAHRLRGLRCCFRDDFAGVVLAVG